MNKYPAWSLLARPYRPYVPACATDIRKTFARVRARQERDDAWADFKRELETRAKT